MTRSCSLVAAPLIVLCNSIWGQEVVPFQHVVIDAHGPPDMHTKSAGDLNGDGLLDLIVAGTGGELVWYAYPTWERQRIAAGGGRWSTDAEVGDIDGDGDQDVVISDWYRENRILWFENPHEGVGTWTPHVVGGPRAHDIELGDFDRDGDLDIVTREQGADGNKLQIWLNKNKSPWEHHVVDCPAGEGLTVSDIDRDGDLDLVIPALWYEAARSPAELVWIEHRYTEQWTHAACVVKTGDLNQDGRLDVVISPAEKQGGSYRVAWYEAPEDPAQTHWTEHLVDGAVETVLHALGVADFNNDGLLDIVIAEMAQGADPDEVRIYLSSEKGHKWTPQVVASTSSHSIRVIDVGGDGDWDIFGADWKDSQQVDLWENLSKAGPAAADRRLALDHWHYVQIDDARQARAFGLAFADLTGDGYVDLASGSYFYRNPGGKMTSAWPRVEFPLPVDALLAVDIDNDDRGDVIALDPSGQLLWLEAEDRLGTAWQARHVGNVGKTDHGISSQGYGLAQFIPGGKPEIVINVGQIYYFQVPDEPLGDLWPRVTVVQRADPEGIAFGDFDRDGDQDLAGTLDSRQVAWWENPGTGAGDWRAHTIGTMPDRYADRFYAADLNGNGRLDLVVAAANGSQNGVYWWRQPRDLARSAWKLHTVVSQATTNSMDAADMDGDGDIDIVAGEHRGDEKVAIWANNGEGGFSEHIISTGRESHLGTRVVDLDRDGDFDIVSIAWDDYQYMHLWRNDAVQKR